MTKMELMGVGGIVLALLGLIVVGGVKEEAEWKLYSEGHNCREAGYIAGSSGVGIGPVSGGNGGVAVISTYTPRKTRYVCDNGEEIYR